ncbi:hypothetical protein HYT56_04230 [Candidatus Woesearchaeota archaeon]|nr:hypothetical protein [Candidatus Woesearchaeota archaeon]
MSRFCPKLSINYLENLSPDSNPDIEDIADYFETDKNAVIDEMNRLGMLVNAARSRNERVIMMSGFDSVTLNRIKRREDLLSVGYIAYEGWKDGKMEFGIYFFRKNRAFKWHPSHLVNKRDLLRSLKDNINYYS